MSARHEGSISPTRARGRRALLLLLVPLAIACGERAGDTGRGDTTTLAATDDSAFAAVQERGQGVMGVDQYTSQHVFEDLPDGGRIVLDRDDAADTAAVATIRRHMQEVAADFRAGDFAKPFAVHAQSVPGTDVMAARRATLQYDVVERPRGAEVRIRSTDPAAIAAVHAFLAFQRSDHRAAGHDGHAAHGVHQPQPSDSAKRP